MDLNNYGNYTLNMQMLPSLVAKLEEQVAKLNQRVSQLEERVTITQVEVIRTKMLTLVSVCVIIVVFAFVVH